MGIFLGAQFFSTLSKKIGRKPTFLISAFIITVSDVGSSLNSNFVMVILLRILQGTAVSSIYSTPYALAYRLVHVLMLFIAKGCSSSAFITLHIQGSELFPLFLRAAGIGLCSIAGAFGGILAPYAVYLQKFRSYAPFMAFSGAMAIASFCASWLPETVNRILPTTVLDAENFEKDFQCFRCTGCPVFDVRPTHRDLTYYDDDVENENSESVLSPTRNYPALYAAKSDSDI
ncbi:carcinine transporter [Nephila pilipes]|uniref:Carcinine transporter n=1 Tax=Nephila pilipes TaxID=299642 RepID=A0A8X6QT61_NEPPI|nr:carcinine transporter [Nephila pilipes]